MTQSQTLQSAPASPPRPGMKRYVPAVGPKLKKLLSFIFAVFALLCVNSAYLLSITIAGVQYQDYFYLLMFALHVALGVLITVPVVVFGIAHIRNARNRPNRRAVRMGYLLYTTSLLLLASGYALLTRADGALAQNAPLIRNAAYWVHVVSPVAVIWIFILHRLAGRRIKWKVGLAWATVAAVFAGVMLIVQSQDPRAWNVAGPKDGEQYFFPSLARTSTGNFIAADVLDNNQYCLECHADIHDQWLHSVHRFSSFNNPPYEFSVKNTRRAMMERDGNVRGSRFCAGCHDPVPFFSGAFDDPKFDDPEYDLSSDPTAQAGITCTVCHSIAHINSPRGNADYTIDEPIHYPFTYSTNPALQWINRQLVKAKPAFHKATFLKPLHSTTEFCGTCHKVHLPPELNDYKWLRGQNHHDAFWLSGVSGYFVSAFYYPQKAETNCNGCHMPLQPVTERPNFAAKVRDDSQILKTFNHQFPSANTAIPYLMRDELPDADAAIAAHMKFNEGVMRVDIFALRQDGRIDGELLAPLRPDVPSLQPGSSYLIESVIRTVKMGHLFTQGTVDSNEVWLDVTVTCGDQIIGRSGGLDPASYELDPWSHYVNAFVIDRHGNRINRRNAEDIFIPLYNNQIPPGAADVVHYLLHVPHWADQPITVEVKLRYRKFDTEYMRLVMNDPNYVNDLPIMTLAQDRVVFPVLDSRAPTPANEPSRIDLWQRWNDYGIGLLRKGEGRGQLRQAEEAFTRVEELGRFDGPLNLARLYINEGRVQSEAPAALARAAAANPPAYQWSLLWWGAQVAIRNGDYDIAIKNMRDIIRGGFTQAEGKNFDFSKDYTLLNALGNALYQVALRKHGDDRTFAMNEARDVFAQALVYDPENLAAHYGLKQIYADLGDTEREAYHASEHARYKPDDNARDFAVAQARMKYPAANHAAEAVVIYDLHRPGAFGLISQTSEVARHD